MGWEKKLVTPHLTIAAHVMFLPFALCHAGASVTTSLVSVAIGEVERTFALRDCLPIGSSTLQP